MKRREGRFMGNVPQFFLVCIVYIQLCTAAAAAAFVLTPSSSSRLSLSSSFSSSSSSSAQSSTTSSAVSDKDDISDLFRHIFTNDIPMLDVRAEVEFSKGAFPTSVNIPILDDEQRHLVGCCYKEEGPDAAFELGKKLVGPLQKQRVTAWADFAKSHPDGYLYCFRGGSRSHISQEGLKEGAGIEYPLIPGGYKRMRQYLIDELEHIPDLPVVMIGGRTGSGKTRLLKQLTDATQIPHVDLEGLANHRGSAFGALVQPQPSQINFENALAIEFLKLQNDNTVSSSSSSSSSSSLTDQPQSRTSSQSPIFIEEEGRRIGQRTLPLSMYGAMVEKYPVVDLVTSIEERVEICVQDYVTNMFPLFEAKYSANGSYGEDDDDIDDDNNNKNNDKAMNTRAHDEFRHVHLKSLARIQKRVPDYDIIHDQVVDALDLFQKSGEEAGFEKPIRAMLRYYDKMYDYQADANRNGPVLFRGDREEIIEWANSPKGRSALNHNV